MRKFITFGLVLILISSCSRTKVDFSKLYSQIFIYSEIDSCEFDYRIEIDTTSRLSKYKIMLEWTYLHYFSKPNQSLIDSIIDANNCDSLKIKNQLLGLLLNDKLFNDYFQSFYLRLENITDQTDKYQISIDSLQSLVSYFYYAKRFAFDNSIQYGVCAIRNPFENISNIDPILIEIGGFCMLTCFQNEQMFDEFAKYRELIDKESSELKLINQDLIDYKSKRIQYFMKHSSIVKKAILDSYSANKTIFGFEIK